MSEFMDFLASPDISEIEETVKINDRIGSFIIKPMTQTQWESYRSRCSGKLSKKGVDFDNEKFNNLVLVGQVVKPNFSDAAMLSKAGCTTPAELIAKKILPGEIAEIVSRITKLSGFDIDINEDIEEAKNE